MGLTKKDVEKLKKVPGRHFDADGLYLQVPEPGEKQPRKSRASWLLRYQLHKRERWLGLGKLANFDLTEARERARKARQVDRRRRGPGRRAPRRATGAGGEGAQALGYPDVQAGGGEVPRPARCRLEEREAQTAVGQHAGQLRLPEDRQAARRRDNDRRRARRPPADLDGKARDGVAAARAGGVGAVVGDRRQGPGRPEPGALVREPGAPAAEEGGQWHQASRGAAL